MDPWLFFAVATLESELLAAFTAKSIPHMYMLQRPIKGRTGYRFPAVGLLLNYCQISPYAASAPLAVSYFLAVSSWFHSATVLYDIKGL